jgi:hypothetical protein
MLFGNFIIYLLYKNHKACPLKATVRFKHSIKQMVNQPHLIEEPHLP